MRVTDHIASIELPFEVVLPSGERLRRSVFSHVVHGERAVVVDAGTAGSAGQIISMVVETCGRGRAPEALLLTHTHPDHIGSARTLKDELGVEVYCPAGELSWLEDVDAQARARPVPGFAGLVEGPVRDAKPISEDFAIDLGGVTLKAIPTPGHSPASTSYEVVEDNAVICGDAIPLLTEPPIYDDALASLASIGRLGMRRPEHLLPSWHGPLHGTDVDRHVFDGESVILRFHYAASRLLAADPAIDDERGCAKVLAVLGFETASFNPLVVRTFRAHRRAVFR